MASSTPKTIVRQWPSQAGPKYFEGIAGTSIITPGEELDFSSGNLILNLQAGTGGAEQPQKMVAVESETASTSAGTAAINQDYAAGDTVRYVIPVPGAVLYMYLKSGENVARGDALVPDGAGSLQKRTGTIEPARYYADEAVNASGGRTRIHARAA